MTACHGLLKSLCHWSTGENQQEDVRMNNQGKLAGRKALVTGSGTGIGREIALEFARQGADVVLHYGHSEGGAKTAVEEIRRLGRRSAAFQADFKAVEKAAALADEAVDFLGGIDCLVNNAGITMNRPFLKVTVEQFDALMHVNIRSPFFLAQRVVQHMLEHGGGAICNLTSIHGVQGAPEHSVYAATKGAIIAYTRTLGIELAHKGIRFNAIAPGWITVENHFKAMPGITEEEYYATAERMIPVARAGRTMDVARLAVFLCSSDAEFIIGQTIIVDGGSTALMSLMPDFRTESTARFGLGYVTGV
jgi:NAD(P)-dependent dehydrogenase (short-subunit alcohol dehydrogenase family)